MPLYQSSRSPPPPDLKSYCPLGPRMEPRYPILFSQKSWQANPLHVPQWDPYERSHKNEEAMIPRWVAAPQEKKFANVYRSSRKVPVFLVRF
jgi:hypothetical protein